MPSNTKPLEWDDFENGVSDLLAEFEGKDGKKIKWHEFITRLYELVYGEKP